jgi:hypothetical protein
MISLRSTLIFFVEADEFLTHRFFWYTAIMFVYLFLASVFASTSINTFHLEYLGFGSTIGGWLQPPKMVPNGLLPHLAPVIFEVQGLVQTAEKQEYRLDARFDVGQAFLSYSGTTRPRFPMTFYQSTQYAQKNRRTFHYSKGLHIEVGYDRFVVQEKLRSRPALAIAPVLRFGREYTLWKVKYGRYIYGMCGLDIGSDPNHTLYSRHIRFGIEFQTLYRIHNR